MSCVRVGTDQELSLESSLTGLIADVIIYQNTTIDMVILSFRDMIKEYFLFEISKTVDPPHARVYTQKVTIVFRDTPKLITGNKLLMQFCGKNCKSQS